VTKQQYQELLQFLLKCNDRPRVIANETPDKYELRLQNEQKDFWLHIELPKKDKKD
jgi:hypothetical protein